MPDTDRKGRKKYSGFDPYPERDYEVSPSQPVSIEDKIVASVEEAPSVVEAEKIFDQQGFTEKLYSIRDETQARLQEMYPGRDVEVRVVEEKGRDFKTQEAYKARGASRTDFSLHQFGAAGDFQIFIDGIIQSGERGETEMYQVLGNVAQDRGLFWGFGGDSGHVAHSRYVSGLLEDFPHLAKTDIAMDWYERKFNKAEMKYKPTMSVMDKILGRSNPDREYTNPDITRESMERPLLDAIPPAEDSAFFIGPHQAQSQLAKTVEPKNPFSMFAK